MVSQKKDAARYRWLRAQTNLSLRTLPQQGAQWTNVETGEKYYSSHCLDVNGTGFGGLEKLDDLIDQAMELYP
jgi:hypothetical protein